MPMDVYETYAQSSIVWMCSECGLPNSVSNLPSIFDISPDLLSNSFSHLEDSLSDEEHIGQPVATSSPTGTRYPNRQTPPTKHTNRKLKAIVINCDGLYSKIPLLENVIDEQKPDIIIGTESHLKSHIFTAEITPPGFVTYRKDRLIGRKGGVFIMVSDRLIASECNITVSEAELLWIEIHVQGCKPLIIGSFYRPPSSAPSNLHALSDSIDEIQQKYKNAVVVIGGDFNLADIDWINRVVKPYAIEPSKCSLLLNICNDHFLDQSVKKPTRIVDKARNILDLVLTTHSNFVEDCDVTGGISDHLMPIFTLNLKPKYNKKQPRKVFLYSKADKTSLHSDMAAFQTSFFNNSPDQHTVQENWDLFKNEITNLMNKHIPSKMTKPTQSKPWITREIRRQSKKKQRLFNRAKSTQKASDWAAFKAYQKQLQKKCRKICWEFQKSMFDETSDNSHKSFWKFINAKKQEPTSVSSLKTGNKVIFDSRGKATAFNSQFSSVFTCENTNNIPDLGDSTIPAMSSIVVSCNGVLKLLNSLNIRKATGPDTIPARILKELALEIAPVLAYIFQKSLDSGQAPSG
jgi:hypothetical protein